MVNSQSGILITFVLIYTAYFTYGFNLSPKPNKVFINPFLNKSDPTSSYFGFALNLRESSVIVGAPQYNYNGSIFICPLYSNGSLQCQPIKFSRLNSVNAKYGTTGEWLGAAMDGGFKDSDKLVACAPRFMKYRREIYCNGLCYLLHDTFTKEPITTQLFFDDFQKTGGREQGFSVHMTNEKDEILMGAPNNKKGTGAVILSGQGFNYSYINHHIKKKSGELKPYADVPLEYFGYSVSSGNFNTTRLDDTQYITSSPHTNLLYGEVIIFEIKNNVSSIKHSFNGTHFGAYFGYAILVEDLNNDGLSDVIITAPMYSTQGNIDQGAVFVYMNKGNFTFELPKTIPSPINNGSRFGTTISKLGDINGDSFNDVAIGAPYANNGTVFIYLGSPSGLSTNSSQNLTIKDSNHEWGPYLFGYGLSKGCDIDKNGFNDIAVGAPNAQTVYVFQAYPVVKVVFLNSTQKITIHQSGLDIPICYKLMTTSVKIKEQNITLMFNLDPELKRGTWNASKTDILVINKTANVKEQCLELNALLSVDSIQPIKLDISYNLIDKIPDTEEFCEKCAVLDPAEPNHIEQSIEFILNADLSVTCSKLYHNKTSGIYIVTYEVTNLGEKAFEPEILVTSSNKIPFKNIPPLCDEKEDEEGVLLCKLNNKRPMDPKSKVYFTIAYDVSQITRSSVFELLANVSSAGKETNINDNIVKNIIDLRTSYKAEIQAISTSGYNMAENESKAIFKVQNTGLDAIMEIQFILEIPISNVSTETPIVEQNSIKVHGTYSKQNLTLKQLDDVTNGTLDYKDPDNHFREILFYCSNSKTISCARMAFNVSNFLPNDTIQIFVNYNVYLSQIYQMFVGEKTHFAIVTKLVVVKTDGNKYEVLQIVSQKRIWNIRPEYIPTLVIISAIIGGILLLIALSIILWKVGFFRRPKRDECNSPPIQGEETGNDNPVFHLEELEAPKGQIGNDNPVFRLDELETRKCQTELESKDLCFDNKTFDKVGQ